MFVLRCALLLATAVAVPTPRVDPTAVAQLFHAGVATGDIASQMGCSQRWVQYILGDAGLLKSVLPVHPELADVVRIEAARHGPNYGGEMLLGALKARHPGWHFPRAAVRAALWAADPEQHNARRNWAHRRIERGAYYAPHFAYSFHLDLACKLQVYRLYVGAILDGCTRTVLGLVALTDKLPTTVHEQLFLPVVEQTGMPDQLVTDKGVEWCVAAFVCFLAARRWGAPRTRRPHRFVQSKRNTVVERFNYEINMRVLVPFRRLITCLERLGLLSQEEPTQVHAFSTIAQSICQYGLDLLTEAWNAHGVSRCRGRPGTGGVPTERRLRSPHPGGQVWLPDGFDGVGEYEAVRGEVMRREPPNAAALDPLLGLPDRQAARAEHVQSIMGYNMDMLWMEVVHCSYNRFMHAYVAFLEFQ